MKLVPPITRTRMPASRELQPEPHRQSGGSISERAGGGTDRAVGDQAEELDSVPTPPAWAHAPFEVPFALSSPSPSDLLDAEAATEAPDPALALIGVAGDRLEDREAIG